MKTSQGNLDDPELALLELADVIVKFSEIDLLQSQAKQIARQVVEQVRKKVAHTTVQVPSTDDGLRHDKGIVIEELLKVLSLSADAYRELRVTDDGQAVRTLSRLDRFCKRHNLTDQIVAICRFKAGWDAWRTVERHFQNSVDYLALERRARDVLTAGMTLERLTNEAKAIASEFGQLAVQAPLTPGHVLGLIFSIAAESEQTPGA